MANRAYLFVTDDSDERNPRRSGEYPEDWYYDSRWCVPLAWFFFFEPGDVRLVPVQGWYEVCVRAVKWEAIERLNRREPLLRVLVDAAVEWERVVALRDDLDGMVGKYLVLNPDEVLGGMSGDDEWHAERFRTILAALDHPPPLDAPVTDLLDCYVGSRDLKYELTVDQMVGYTYVREGRDYGRRGE